MTHTSVKDMNQEERSLLLFLETRAVDYGGRVDTAHMNELDMEIARSWHAMKFIQFGRIRIADHNPGGTHWVYLSRDAWEIAHKLRHIRAERMWINRPWKKTSEKS